MSCVIRSRTSRRNQSGANRLPSNGSGGHKNRGQPLVVTRTEKLVPHFNGNGQRVIIFLMADVLQFCHHLAPSAVVEHFGSDSNQFLPVVPFTDGILHLTKGVDEPLIDGFSANRKT